MPDPNLFFESPAGAAGLGTYTFYGSYSAVTGADNREPLGSTWATRYLGGGAFVGGANFAVWRDTGGDCRGSGACTCDAGAWRYNGGGANQSGDDNGSFGPGGGANQAGDNTARGYVTVDNAGDCSLIFPVKPVAPVKIVYLDRSARTGRSYGDLANAWWDWALGGCSNGTTPIPLPKRLCEDPDCDCVGGGPSNLPPNPYYPDSSAGPGADESFAFGFRNPFRFTFDAPQGATGTRSIDILRTLHLLNVDGDAGMQAFLDGEGWDSLTNDTLPDPVYLHSGELYSDAVDLVIPGRGFDWAFARNYRSGITFEGPLGHNWDFNYNRRLVLVTEENQLSIPVAGVSAGNVIRMDGRNRSDRYAVQDDSAYQAPPGFFTSLTRLADGSFAERDFGGNAAFYGAPDATGLARLTELRDRNGNRMTFEYNGAGRMVQVIDTLGRPIDYAYDGQGRLIQVTDFIGRTIKLAYDGNGDLVEVTSPSVTGTPNGNDFPLGKTTRYSYTSGFAQPELEHNLLTVTSPNEVASGGPPRVTAVYDTDLSSSNFDRVARLTYGGTNEHGVPAGGTNAFEYASVAGGVDSNDPFTTTTVTDRNGNVTEYVFNRAGDILSRQEQTNRDVRESDPDTFTSRFEYNADSLMTRLELAEGNSFEFVFDDGNPDRLQQGNLLSMTAIADADRGGDQADITTTYTFEPIYNRVRTMTDARGNDPAYVPQNSGANSPERYTTTYTFDYEESLDLEALGANTGRTAGEIGALLTAAGMGASPLGEVNGDGTTSLIGGNVIRLDLPSVRLLDGSNQAAAEGGTTQPIVTTLAYNRFGQVLSVTDPEGNLDRYDYYPTNDPDGDGADLTPGVGDGPFGYPRQMTIDVGGAAIQQTFAYDGVGNVTRLVDGRGVATDLTVNQLNQVTQVTRAAATGLIEASPAEPEPLTAFSYLARFFYDHNNNLVLSQVEDRGDTSHVDGNPLALDLPPNVSNPDPAGGPAFRDIYYKYDILDNVIEAGAEVENGSDASFLRTRFRYDGNENLTLVIQPEGNASTAVYDERDLVFQSTLGAQAAPPSAHLGPGDPVVFGSRGGDPSTVTYRYDGNRNLIEVVDAQDTDLSSANNSAHEGLGDRTRFLYDGFDRLTSAVDSVGNQSVVQYDPASNVVRAAAFGPVGGASPKDDGGGDLGMPVSSAGIIQAGNLVNDNLLSAAEYRYDELSRLIQSDRPLFVNTGPTLRLPNLADGALDLGKLDLTPGDNALVPGIVGIAVNGRVSARFEYDRNSRLTFSVQDDGDVYRRTYDGVDRVVRRVDPEGNAVELAYDDNSNVIEVRETDISQLPEIDDEVFITTSFYDSLNRLQRSVDNLGQTVEYRYDSRSNLVAASDGQGPLTVVPITRRAFTGGPLTVDTTNAPGNVTLYAYDGISRVIRSDRVLTETGAGSGAIGATLEGIPEAIASDLAQGGGDGLISSHYRWDDNSLLTALADDNDNQTLYTYDNLNRRTSETKGICGPNAGGQTCDAPTTTTVSYDRDHNVVVVRDENGSNSFTFYDAINRPVDTIIFPASGVVGTARQSFEYDGLSRLTRATDDNERSDAFDNSTVTFAYDSLSRVIEETQQFGALAAEAVSYGWRAGNLRTQVIYPDGRVLRYTYDGLDRLDQVVELATSEVIADYDYIGPYRLAQRRYPQNGTRLTFLSDDGTADTGYDGLRRPVRMRHLDGDGSLIVGFAQTYNRQNVKLTEAKLHAPGESEVYTYDSAYRLIGFERGALNAAGDAVETPSANAPAQSQWVLDGVGNWTQVDGETREHSSFNEVLSRTGDAAEALAYDDNGNLVEDGQFRYAWDYQNRLRKVTRTGDGAVVARYWYDALNRRIRKFVTGSGALNGVTQYYLEGARVLEERSGIGDVNQQYVYGGGIDEALEMARDLNGDGTATGPGDQRLYYHQNTLGSVFALSDEGGAVTEGYQYEAYGAATVFAPSAGGAVDFDGADATIADGSQVENPYSFTGRRTDAETGLYYYRLRYMDADLGRFISRDPIGYAAGSLGLYEYVGGGQVYLVDPFGLDPNKKTGNALDANGFSFSSKGFRTLAP